jgi:hypothetical protein
MKNIHNNPLFTDIPPEEEVSVQGGNPLVIAALRVAIPRGVAAVRSVLSTLAAKWWLNGSGNGIIFGDKKGTYADGLRAGAGIANDRDIPGSGQFGIKNAGKWFSV